MVGEMDDEILLFVVVVLEDKTDVVNLGGNEGKRNNTTAVVVGVGVGKCQLVEVPVGGFVSCSVVAVDQWDD
jgi:hypothetical protein